MIMPTGILAFSPEFEKAKSNLQSARENYTALVEEYSLLIGVVGKNLETEYMLKLGKKEHELFSCQVEILRLKRKRPASPMVRGIKGIFFKGEMATKRMPSDDDNRLTAFPLHNN